MLNDDKTEFMVKASRHLLKKAAVNTIRVGDCDVSKVAVVRNLGAWFDDQLTMAVRIRYQNMQCRFLSLTQH